jgi:hypothetical protein
MPLDPTLLRAGQVDYSWIPNAVKDGTQFAQVKMHLDQQKQLVQAQLDQHQQQKDMVQMQKGMSVFQDVQRAMSETGSVRKAIIQGAQQKAQLFGLPISPDFWAATTSNDPAYDQKINQAMANLTSPDPATRNAALSTMSGQINSSTWTKLASITSKTGQDQLAAQKAQQQADFQNKSLDLKSQEVGNKDTTTLSKQAGQIEKTYEPLMQKPDLAIALLQKGTAAGDQAAMQLYIRSLGNERITPTAVNANTNIGSAVDRVAALTNKYQDGTRFDDNVRGQLVQALGMMKNTSTNEAKSLLDPVVNQALGNGVQRQKLLGGQIISPDTLNRLYPQLGAKGANSKDSSQSSQDDENDDDSPMPPPGRTTMEQNTLKKYMGQGWSLAAINKGLVTNGRKPMSPAEAAQWKDYFAQTATPPPSSAPPSSSQPPSAASSTSGTAMSGGPGQPDDSDDSTSPAPTATEQPTPDDDDMDQ